MLTAHHVNAFLVIAVCVAAGAAAFVGAAARPRGRGRRAAARARADAVVAQVGARAAPALRPPARRGPPPLRLRDVRAARGALALALRAGRAAARGCCGSPSRPSSPPPSAFALNAHDRMTPFVRNLLILAAVALVIVVSGPETALVDGGDAAAVRVLHRDRGRRVLLLARHRPPRDRDLADP